MTYLTYLIGITLVCGILMLVTEFRVIQNKRGSFGWTQWLWDNISWIRRIRW